MKNTILSKLIYMKSNKKKYTLKLIDIFQILISVILIIIGLVLAIVLISKNDSKDKDQTQSNNQSVEKDNIINYEDAYGTYNNAVYNFFSTVIRSISH